jgi:ABC-type multidrug transport system fused ATPase/permease subunit
MRNPRVIVLDEPTSALDLESERFVQQALEELTRGRTTIIVAHRLTTIRNADLVCVLCDGRLIEAGTHDELLARNGAFARLHAAAGTAAFISVAA